MSLGSGFLENLPHFTFTPAEHQVQYIPFPFFCPLFYPFLFPFFFPFLFPFVSLFSSSFFFFPFPLLTLTPRWNV